MLEVTWGSEPRRLTLEWLMDERRLERIMPEAASFCAACCGRTASVHFCRRDSDRDLHWHPPAHNHGHYHAAVVPPALCASSGDLAHTRC